MAGREVTEKNTCSVCLEVFCEPKVLPCCHTFCLTCLGKTARGNSRKKGEITCPQCRKTHEIPTGGLTELLTDFIATYEVEVAGLKSSSSHKGGEKTLVCGECERPGPVRSYCIDCQNYLCNECGFQLHKMLKAYRGHKVIPIKDINAATLQPCQIHYCKVHKAEALRLYCGTCSKLACRDCTLVEHRQHNYSFVEDARKQVDVEMSCLQSDVKQKLATFKQHLQEIRKVEESATGHAQVLKADINAFFDKLVCSIEARRKVVLEQAETDCQKDLKQIWADKEFHEMTVSHISSVLDLVEKARKCTSDSEMILTALQSIHQLKILKETEWDSVAFVNMVSATSKFIEGEKVMVDAVGVIDHVVVPSCKIQLRSHSKEVHLGSSESFQVSVKSSPTPILIDGRSGVPVNLQLNTSTDFKAVVHYGRSLKQLDDTCVHVSKAHVRATNREPQPQRVTNREAEPHPQRATNRGPHPQRATNRGPHPQRATNRGPQPQRATNRGPQPQRATNSEPQPLSRAHVLLSKAGLICVSKAGRTRKHGIPQDQFNPPDDTYNVRVQPILCGGKHIITFRFGYSIVKHSFTVTGEPQHGVRVKIGPDWKPKGRATPTGENTRNEIGTIINYQNQSVKGLFPEVYQEEAVPLGGYDVPGEGLFPEVYQEEAMPLGGYDVPGEGLFPEVYQEEAMLSGGYDVPGGDKDMVTVKECSGTTCQYKWGRDGEYEIELAPTVVSQTSRSYSYFTRMWKNTAGLRDYTDSY